MSKLDKYCTECSLLHKATIRATCKDCSGKLVATPAEQLADEPESDIHKELMQINRRAEARSLAEAEDVEYKRHVSEKNPMDRTIDKPLPDTYFKQEFQEVANAIRIAATLNIEYGQNLSDEEVNYIHEFLQWHSKYTKLTLLATITAIIAKNPSRPLYEVLGDLKQDIKAGIQEA